MHAFVAALGCPGVHVVSAFAAILPMRSAERADGTAYVSGTFSYLEVEFAGTAEVAAILDAVASGERDHGVGTLGVWWRAECSVFQRRSQQGWCRVDGISAVAVADVQQIAPRGC